MPNSSSPAKSYVLGISAFYHDSAAALLRDGELIAAAQEERFTRKKHDAGYPSNAIAWCLHDAGVQPDELEAVVFYEKPLTTFVRLIRTYLKVGIKGFSSFREAIPLWMRQKLWIPMEIERGLKRLGYTPPKQIWFTEHHESHAASAFYPSPACPRVRLRDLVLLAALPVHQVESHTSRANPCRATRIRHRCVATDD